MPDDFHPLPATHSDAEEAPKDYDVGYKKPPAHTRFQPGKSGNPKGRPKHEPMQKRLLDHMQDINQRKVTVNIGGKMIRVTFIEAILLRLAQNAMNGDIRAMKQYFELCRQLDMKNPPSPSQFILRVNGIEAKDGKRVDAQPELPPLLPKLPEN